MKETPEEKRERIRKKLLENMTPEDMEKLREELTPVLSAISGSLEDVAKTLQAVFSSEEMQRAIINAQKAAEDMEGQSDPDAEDLPEVKKDATPLLWPVDKSQKVFGLLAKFLQDPAGVYMPYSKGGKEGYILQADYDTLSEAVPEAAYLTPYDRRVHNALISQWAAGNRIVSLQAIYELTGGRSDASGKDKKKIKQSINRMHMRVNVTSTEHLYDVTKGKRISGKIATNEDLISTRIIEATVKGHKAECVEILAEPPLLRLSRSWQQLTAIKPELLQMPGTRTDESMKLHDYLVSYIAQLKNHPRTTSNKLLFETLFNEAGIDPAGQDNATRKAKTRIRQKVRDTLEAFKQSGYIDGYTMTANACRIFLPEDTAVKKRKPKKAGTLGNK